MSMLADLEPVLHAAQEQITGGAWELSRHEADVVHDLVTHLGLPPAEPAEDRTAALRDALGAMALAALDLQGPLADLLATCGVTLTAVLHSDAETGTSGLAPLADADAVLRRLRRLLETAASAA